MKKNANINESQNIIIISEDHEFDFVRLFIAYMILLDVIEQPLEALKTGKFVVKKEKQNLYVFPRVREDAIFPEERHDRFSDSVLRNLAKKLKVPKMAIIASSFRKGYVFKTFLEELKTDPNVTKSRILDLLANTPQWKGQCPRTYFKTATTNFIQIRETYLQHFRQAAKEGKPVPNPYEHCPLLTDIVNLFEKNSFSLPSNKELVKICQKDWEKKQQRHDRATIITEIEFLNNKTLNSFSQRRLKKLNQTLQKFASTIPRMYIEQIKSRIVQKKYDAVANDVKAVAYLKQPRGHLILDLKTIATFAHNKCDHTSFTSQTFSATALPSFPVYCFVKNCSFRIDGTNETSHMKEHFENSDSKKVCRHCEKSHEFTNYDAAYKHMRAKHNIRYFCDNCDMYDSQYHPNKKVQKCKNLKNRNSVALIYTNKKVLPCSCPVGNCVKESKALSRFLNVHTLDVSAKMNFEEIYETDPRKARELAFHLIAKTITGRQEVPCAAMLFRKAYGS